MFTISGNAVHKKTSKKFELRPTNRAQLKQQMKYDYDLYHFVHQRFYNVIDKLQRQKSNINMFPQQTFVHPCLSESKELLSLMNTLGYSKADCLQAQAQKSMTVYLSKL